MEKGEIGALEAQIDKLQEIKLGFIILVDCNRIQGVGYIDLTNYNMTTTGRIPILPLQLFFFFEGTQLCTKLL
jgi:hypothetical protein